MTNNTHSVALGQVDNHQWSDARLGVEPREKFMVAMRFAACPFCRGVRPKEGRSVDPNQHFPRDHVGHAPSCLFPKALGTE